MNKVILVGRATKDTDYRGGEKAYARYTLAVDRYGEGADFINCVAFGKSADFAGKYIKKGTKILIEGHITTGSYTDKNGKVQYTTDVIVDRHEFVEPKRSAQTQTQAQPDLTENLPFN